MRLLRYFLPEGKQWFERYVMMKPACIGAK